MRYKYTVLYAARSEWYMEEFDGYLKIDKVVQDKDIYYYIQVKHLQIM